MISQVMTTGAKQPASLVVPNGWITNNNTNIAQDVPTIVAVLMSSLTISRLPNVRRHSTPMRPRCSSIPLYRAEYGLSRS
jgi:hypothetical protein